MRKKLTVGVLALVILAAGCDQPMDLPLDELTPEEAAALAAAMIDQGYTTAEGESGQSGVQGAVVALDHDGVHFEHTMDATVPCPKGGELAVAAEVSGATFPEEDRIVVEMSGTHTHSDCGFEARGSEIVVNGDPNIGWSARFEAVQGMPHGNQELRYEGAFGWSTSTGRSGDCIVDLHVIVDPEAQSQSVTGTFCNVTIESTTTWTTG